MSPAQIIIRYWYTVRHLRARQIVGRIWFAIHRPKIDLRPAPPLRRSSGEWKPPVCRMPTLLGPEEFHFLGKSGNLRDIGWDGPQMDRLWRYNQHYFDDLNAQDSEERAKWHISLLKDWVRLNTLGTGVGWEPYPVSIRIVNWIKWVLAGNELPEPCISSTATQLRWLSKRVETHLLGNHLLANAKALVFGGLFFDSAEAQRWLQQGIRILEHQLPEQILCDGGHFELSTMYHALVLEDVLDLCNVTNCFQDALREDQLRIIKYWPIVGSAMAGWLHNMCHPDGRISFFNDAAFGVAPTFAELASYGERLGMAFPSQPKEFAWLPESGYLRLASADAVLLADMAEIGPDYLPGHGHADTLSFELSLFGQRVIVNSGTSCYGIGVERLRQRGTSAHNTVIVNGQDSSEVWGDFRVARRAKPVSRRLMMGEKRVVSCGHDGYRRLPGSPMHHRVWAFGDRVLAVTDTIVGAHDCAEARYHLHPLVRVDSDSLCVRGVGLLPDGHEFYWSIDEGVCRIEEATWHPAFGVIEPTVCIVVRLVAGRAQLRLTWE